MKQQFEQIIIRFETPELPPPFSYRLDIECHLADDALAVRFIQEYTQRDAVEEEEILAEGYSGKDDFQWQGKLPAVWLTHLQKHLDDLKLVEKNSYLILSLKDGNTSRSGSPQNREKWEYLIQELTQAVFEESKKEMPLQMGIMQIYEQKQNVHWLEFRFAHFAIVDEKGKKVIDWYAGRELLQLIFMLDFEEPEANKPVGNGTYIDPGDGYWYHLGTGALNPHPQNDVQGKIINKLKQLWG